MEALEPYAVPMAPRSAGDPAPLEYLSGDQSAFDVTLEVYLQSREMRERRIEAVRVSRGNLRDLYWSIAQLVAHHSSNGCNLRPGDLLGTGTISGAEEGSEGCLLEMRHRAQPLELPTGETLGFLEDGDEVIFRAFAEKPGMARIGFGGCSGRIDAASR
jgi:fumarylacetoacetase